MAGRTATLKALSGGLRCYQVGQGCSVRQSWSSGSQPSGRSTRPSPSSRSNIISLQLSGRPFDGLQRQLILALRLRGKSLKFRLALLVALLADGGNVSDEGLHPCLARVVSTGCALGHDMLHTLPISILQHCSRRRGRRTDDARCHFIAAASHGLRARNGPGRCHDGLTRTLDLRPQIRISRARTRQLLRRLRGEGGRTPDAMGRASPMAA